MDRWRIAAWALAGASAVANLAILVWAIVGGPAGAGVWVALYYAAWPIILAVGLAMRWPEMAFAVPVLAYFALCFVGGFSWGGLHLMSAFPLYVAAILAHVTDASWRRHQEDVVDS